jgi:hypothetical protein
MGLSEFPDTLSPVILHLGGDIGDKNRCSEIALIRRRRFFYFAFVINAYICIHNKAWSW